MKSSNLAERLEEFEATIDTLRLSPSPETRQIAVLRAPHSRVDQPRPLRRASRARGIEIRGQGLRSFRVY